MSEMQQVTAVRSPGRSNTSLLIPRMSRPVLDKTTYED